MLKAQLMLTEPPMVLGDVYPAEPTPKPKINPSLLTSKIGSLRRLSEGLKVVLVQSELSPKEILASGSYKPPELVEDLLRDFNKYGVYFKEPNTAFLNSLDSSSQLTDHSILYIIHTLLLLLLLFIILLLLLQYLLFITIFE